MRKTSAIDLAYLWKHLRKNWAAVFLSAVFGLGIAFCITNWVIDKKYVSVIKLYVYISSEDSLRLSDEVSALTYAQRVVNTYIQMLRTYSFYERVQAAAGSSYTAEELEGMISFSSLNGTEIFSAAVMAEKPEDARRIAQAIGEIAPGVISGIKETGELKIVDPPRLNLKPVSPNLKLNLTLGIISGCVISFGFLLLKDLTNARIQSAAELNEKYGLFILAEISDIGKAGRKKRASKYRGRKL
ncbi:MAG: hypothetical protein LBB94_11855 [Clostridiales bacterium]|jgi:capsular polysaccharide biosynthesis protein|nr:hypothetical protein [Clostridiales bacterium]